MALTLPRFEVLDGRSVGARYEMLTVSEVAAMFGYRRQARAGEAHASPATTAVSTPPLVAGRTADAAPETARRPEAHPRPRRQTAPRRSRAGSAPAIPRAIAHPTRSRAGRARRTEQVAPPMVSRPPARRRTLGDAVGVATGILLVLSLLAAWAVLALAVAQHVYGYETLTVLSGSMRPTIPVGALVVEHKVPAGSIRAGDVISFHPGNNRAILVTHRVVEIRTRTVNNASEAYFVTRGDANPVSDPGGVPARGDIGRMTASYPLAGYATWWLQQPPVRTAMLVLPLVLMATMVMTSLLRPRPTRRAS